jgi:hypothetical protein
MFLPTLLPSQSSAPLPIPCRLALHAAGGPLHSLVQRLLAAGTKSWRIMGIVSLQVAGC